MQGLDTITTTMSSGPVDISTEPCRINTQHYGCSNNTPQANKESPWRHHGHNIVDLLRTAPSRLSFSDRVKALNLSISLERKILTATTTLDAASDPHCSLSENDEKELATEVLLYRHTFTQLVFRNDIFRQATLTIVQNIYLFQHRRIFFSSNDLTPAQERQEALLLFSQSPHDTTIPLALTLQHMILARVWDRIVSQASDSFLKSRSFTELHEVVARLNCLRNIYMLLTTGLVRRLTTKISNIYRQSVTREDAHQIGSFGIARAAYRYHHSFGFRFSTYAGQWILKEIQRQSLENRLIRISSNMVEQFSRTARQGDCTEKSIASQKLTKATAQFPTHEGASPLDGMPSPALGPAWVYEQKELHTLLLKTIDRILSQKSCDIIKRRYGLGCYRGREQSVIEIGRLYGVTRGSIYQLEQSAMQKLRKHLGQLIG